MKKTIKKIMFTIGFIPAFVVGLFCLMILYYDVRLMTLPLFITLLLMIIIPICFYYDCYKIMAFVGVIILSLIHFIFASLENQMMPSSIAISGIFLCFFYSIYYYILKIW